MESIVKHKEMTEVADMFENAFCVSEQCALYAQWRGYTTTNDWEMFSLLVSTTYKSKALT